MSVVHTVISQQMIERLGWMLVHFVWQAAVVAVLLALMLRLLRRSSSNVRYATACAALGLIMVLPLVTAQLVKVTRPVAEAGPPPASLPLEETPEPVVEVSQSPTPAYTPTHVELLPEPTATPPTPLKDRFVSKLAPALPYLVFGWLVGVFGLSAWHLGGWAQLQRLKKRMVRPVADAVHTRLTVLADRLGIHRAVGLLESMLVDVPTVVGWIEPVILLPASALTGLNGEQLEAILAHELAHIRRYDYLVNILQTVVEILGFYHPALWWVSRRIRIERENCCDDLAVQICGDSVRYARALTHLEEIRHSRTQLAVAADGGSLISRIARLLGHPTKDDRRFAWLPGLIALVLVAGLIVLAVCGMPAKGRPELAEGASNAMPDSVTTNKTEPNDTVTAKTPTQELQIRLEFIVAEVFADRALDSNTAAKMVNHVYREMPGPTSIDGRSRSFMTRKATLQEISQPLGEVFTTCDAGSGDSEAVLNLLLSGGYAEIASRPKVLANEGQEVTVVIGNYRDPNLQQTGDLTFKLAVTPRIDWSVGNSVRLMGAFNPGAPSLGMMIDGSGVQSFATLDDGEFTRLRPTGLTSRVDQQGRKRLSLVLVKGTIVNAPKGETQTLQDATAHIATEVRNTQPARGNAGGQVQFEFLMADLYGDKVLDDDTASQISPMLYYRPSRGNSERTRPDPKNLRRPLKQVLWGQYDVEQPEALVALLESRGYASVHRVPALSTGFDQPISISVANLPRSNEPNETSGGEKPWCTFNISANGRLVSPEPNPILLQGKLDERQPDGTRAGIPSPAGLASRPATTGKYVIWPVQNDRTDKDGRARRLLLFVKPTVISRPSGGGGRGGSPVMGGIAPGRGLPTPAEPARHVAVDFILADLFADRVVDAETAGQIANLLYRQLPESRVRPNPDELRTPLDEVLANCPPEPNQVRRLIDVLTARGFCQILTPPSRILMEERHIFVRRFGDSREPDDPNADNANGLAFGATILPDINDSNQTVSLHMQFLQPLVLSRDPNGAPPANHAAATLPNGVYRTVQASFALHADRDGNRRRPYLLAKATFGGPEESVLAQQETQPASATRDANESNGQVLYKSTILRVRPEKKVDRPTASELSRILGKPLDTIEGIPTKQVLQMITDASADQFVAAVKLLDSCGYAEVVARPALLGRLGQRAKIEIGSADAGGFKLEVLAEEVKDKYAVKLVVDLDLGLTKIAPPPPGWTGDANDLPRTIEKTRNSFTLEVPDGKYAVQALSGLTQGPPTDPNGEALYLIASVVVNKEKQARVKTQPPSNLGEEHKAQVHIAFTLAKLKTEAVPDHPTLMLIGAVLESDNPQAVKEIANIGPKQKTTIGNVLKKYVTSQSLSEQTCRTLVDLLQSRGFLKLEAEPNVVATDTRESEIRNTSYKWFLLSESKGPPKQTEIQKIEYGTVIKVTPRIEPDKHVMVQMAVKQIDLAPARQSIVPTVRTQEVASTVTIPDGRCMSFLVEPKADEKGQATNAESLLVICRPKILAPPPDNTVRREVYLNYQTPARVAGSLSADWRHYVTISSDSSSHILTVTAPPELADRIVADIKALDVRPRQVLLTVRVVAIDRAELSKLGFDWASPKIEPGETPVDRSRPYGIQVGYSSDPNFTNSLRAKLNRLAAANRAGIIANPQLMAIDGHPAKIQSARDEWFMMTGRSDLQPTREKIEAGITMTMTPRIGDNNDIQLELAIEVSHLIPPADGNGAPIVSRRTAKNFVVIPDGGTAGVAGLDPNDQTKKDLAIFVTASVTPDKGATAQVEAVVPPARRPPQAVTSAPSVKDPNGQVLSKFIIAKVRPERKVDQQTARELSRILDASLDGVENAPVRQVLQMAAGASVNRCGEAVKLLESSGYVEVLSKPTMLSPLGRRGQIDIGSRDPNDIKPGQMILGYSLGVLADEMQDKYAVKLAVDLNLRLARIAPAPPGWTGDTKNLPTSIQSTQNHIVLEVPDGKCAVGALSGLTQGPPTDPNSEAFYLMASAVVNKGTPAKTETQPPSSQNANDQILTQFIVAKGRKESRIDHQTAIDLAGILDAPVGSIEGTQTVLLLQARSNTISAERFVAMLARLDSAGCIHVLTQPRVLTNPGQPAQIHIGGGMGDLKLGVTARRLEDKQKIRLDMDVNLISIGVQTRVYFETPENRYTVGAFGGLARNSPGDANDEVLYLMANPTAVTDTSKSKEELEGRMPMVGISLRLISIGEAFLKNIEQGRPNDKALSTGEVQMLQRIGEKIARQERSVLDETQAQLLVRSCQSQVSGRTLTAPRATVIVGEPIYFSMSDPVFYVSGSDLPNPGSGQPSPSAESIWTGLRCQMVTRAMSDNQIAVDANLTLAKVEVPMKDVRIPDGRTALIVGPKVRTAPGAGDSVRNPEAQPLLILITVERTDDSAYPPMRRQMDGFPLPRTSQQGPSTNSTVEELSRRIAALEANLTEMGQTLSAQHPSIVRQRAMLDAYKKELAQSQQDPQAQERALSEAKTSELTRRIAVLEGDLIEMRQRLSPHHPDIVHKQAILDTYRKELAQIQQSAAANSGDRFKSGVPAMSTLSHPVEPWRTVNEE